MIAWTLLLKYWRIAAFAAVALLATWAWVVVGHWHEDSLTLPRVVAQAKADAAQAAATLDSWKKAYKSAQEASESYAHELESIHNQPTPSGHISVCRSTSMPASPATGAGPGKPGATTAPAPVVHPTDALAVGPLYDLARRCDELSAQVRALQQFIATQ